MKKERVTNNLVNFKEIIAYSLGLFAVQAVMGLVNSYQAEFYASTMGADLTFIGILLLIAKAISSIFDPVVGNLIDRKEGKRGKLKPFIFLSIIPIVVLTIVIFIKVPFRGVGLYIYIFIIYVMWSIAVSFADVPSQGIAAVITPNPKERSKIVSLANTFKSIGPVACFVIAPLASVIVPGGASLVSGTINATEYLVTAIIIAVLAGGMITLMAFSNKERVPYKAEKMSVKQMFATVKGNKPLLIVVMTYILGFGRQMAMGIQVQAAVALLGGANKIIILGITSAVGSMISMLLVPILIKKFNERNVYIGMSIYGAVVSVITYFVGINNLAAMLAMLFFLGLQFGALNIIPMIMVADSVDYYEYKTGKRTEGLSYAILSLMIKLSLAAATGLGLVLVAAYGYRATEGAVLSEATRKGVYFVYTVVPGISSLLCAIPLFFYDLVGKKKDEVTRALAERRQESAKSAEITAEN